MALISCMQLRKEHLSLSISPQKPPNWKSKQEKKKNKKQKTRDLEKEKEKVQDIQEPYNNYKGVAYV